MYFRSLSDEPQEGAGVRLLVLLTGQEFFPLLDEDTAADVSTVEGYLPQLYKQPCALMSTICWASAPGFKTTVGRGNHNWYRNTGLIGRGGDCSQLDGMCLL